MNSENEVPTRYRFLLMLVASTISIPSPYDLLFNLALGRLGARRTLSVLNIFIELPWFPTRWDSVQLDEGSDP